MGNAMSAKSKPILQYVNIFIVSPLENGELVLGAESKNISPLQPYCTSSTGLITGLIYTQDMVCSIPHKGYGIFHPQGLLSHKDTRVLLGFSCFLMSGWATEEWLM